MTSDDKRSIPRVVYEEDHAEPGHTTVLSDVLRARPAPTQRPYLIVVGGRRSLGKLFPLQNGAVLGRAVSCDIVLEEEGVSRRHARFEVSADGAVIKVDDLGSANGLLFAGVRAPHLTLRD